MTKAEYSNQLDSKKQGYLGFLFEQICSTFLCPAYHHWNMYNCDCCKCLNVDFLLCNHSLWLGKKFIFNFIHDSIISKSKYLSWAEKAAKTRFPSADDNKRPIQIQRCCHCTLCTCCFILTSSHSFKKWLFSRLPPADRFSQLGWFEAVVGQ